MVGGKIMNIVTDGPEDKWVQCVDRTYSNDTCAIRVKTREPLKVGDSLWWQGRQAFWTPKPDEGREDIPLERIGYSHSKIPDDIIEKLA
jgi:hypothetical protein